MGDQRVVSPEEAYNPAVTFRNVPQWVTRARRRGWGMWAWVLHRVTAILLLFGTLFHVLANHFGYTFPLGTLLTDDLVVFAGAYHGFNGVRLLLIETFAWASRNEDKLFWACLAATFLFCVYWAWVIGL
ncbi:MAG: hypothetical protein DRO06_01270 [Thermoproteota archaeon]|nr:MAG: hypothetical protein DRO06_01270 [Candidatus Korarchaeota archaeon]